MNQLRWFPFPEGVHIKGWQLLEAAKDAAASIDSIVVRELVQEAKSGGSTGFPVKHEYVAVTEKLGRTNDIEKSQRRWYSIGPVHSHGDYKDVGVSVWTGTWEAFKSEEAGGVDEIARGTGLPWENQRILETWVENIIAYAETLQASAASAR